MPDTTKKDTVELEKVRNKFYGSAKKVWQRTFVDYEIWWWILTLALLVWAMILSLQYLPIIMPDTFRDQNAEKPLTPLPDLTVFYPARVVPGHEYKMDFSFRIPDNLPNDTDRVIFQLNSDPAGTKLDPVVIEYASRQTGRIVQQVTLNVLESSTPHDKVVISVKSPQFAGNPTFQILIVNRSYSVGLLITFVATFGALILKVLSPLFKRLGDLARSRFLDRVFH